MKKLYAIVICFAFLTSFTVMLGLDDVIVAIKAGNANQVSKYFDNTVEISMPEKSNSYSKSQAELVLKDFFISYAVKGFDIIHRGDNAGSQYCIGTLTTKNGSFRTTIFMKQKKDLQVIQEIRFENR